jgi:glycolate oxidase FAD binding subunit
MTSERAVVLPASTADAAAALRDAAERDLTVVPRGAGLGWIELCGDLIVGTSKLDQVIEHAAGDWIARVQAGATMGHVAEVLAMAGQRLALDVPPEVTVGGMIATGLAGPLRFRYGSPRDLLIGITLVRADGVVARSGGKVVKNVAGYDLGRLFAGSRGTLGLITEATFRLHPLPQAVAYLTADLDRPAAVAAVIAAANSPLQPSAVELAAGELSAGRLSAGGLSAGGLGTGGLGTGGRYTVGVLLEGTTDGVAERARRMTELLGSAKVTSAPPPWWGQLPAPPGTVIRIAFWLARLAEVLDVIEKSGVECTVTGPAGAGMLYVCVHDDAGGLVPALRAAVGDRGSVAVLTGPPGPPSALMSALRDQFDPGHRMGGA